MSLCHILQIKVSTIFPIGDDEKKVELYYEGFHNMSKTLESGTHVFLFNADTPELGGNYGYPCNKALFDSVLKNNTLSNIYSRVFSGDLVVQNLCSQKS